MFPEGVKSWWAVSAWVNVRLTYRDYRTHKKAVRLRLREIYPNAVVARWIRRKDVVRWLEYGLIDPPELTPALYHQLMAIPRARYSPPCAAAELDDGSVEECVVFIESTDEPTPYLDLFDVPAKRLVPCARLRRISSSPKKLPAFFEQMMDEHGETHMGGMVVNFVLRDGTKFGHAQGSASSAFVTMPGGHAPEEIVDVEFLGDPGVVQVTPSLSGPDWKYCAFRAPTDLRTTG